MRKLEILLDLDSTAANLEKKWYGHYNAEYNDDMTPDRVTSWNVHEFVKSECGLKIYDYLKIPGFFSDLPVLPGCRAALDAWRSDGHHITVVSALADGAAIAPDKQTWCKTELDIGKKDIIFAHHKELVVGDVILDDGPHNIAAYRSKWHQALILTIAYPYNDSVASLCRRFGSWRDPKLAWDEMKVVVDDYARAEDAFLICGVDSGVELN